MPIERRELEGNLVEFKLTEGGKERARLEARSRGYSRIILSSVGDSSGFWKQLGYDPVYGFEGGFEKDLEDNPDPMYRVRRPQKSLKVHVRGHLKHPPRSCLCHQSKTVDRARRGLLRRLK